MIKYQKIEYVDKKGNVRLIKYCENSKEVKRLFYLTSEQLIETCKVENTFNRFIETLKYKIQNFINDKIYRRKS
jgi:hypothetical protein